MLSVSDSFVNLRHVTGPDTKPKPLMKIKSDPVLCDPRCQRSCHCTCKSVTLYYMFYYHVYTKAKVIYISYQIISSAAEEVVESAAVLAVRQAVQRHPLVMPFGCDTNYCACIVESDLNMILTYGSCFLKSKNILYAKLFLLHVFSFRASIKKTANFLVDDIRVHTHCYLIDNSVGLLGGLTFE